MSAIEQTPEGLRLKIILQPKASKDQIVGLHDDELKITITAPPVDGQANAHLLKFLSKTFKVPKSSIDFEFQIELIWEKESKLVYVGLIHLFQELSSF